MLLISVAKIGVFDFPFVWMIFWDDRCSMHTWFVSLSSGSARTTFVVILEIAAYSFVHA